MAQESTIKKRGLPKGKTNNPKGRPKEFSEPYKKRNKQISMMVPIDKWDECNAAMRAAVAKVLK
jgi:hypothetical protein